MSKVAITKSKLDNLANAVAAKSGESVLLTVDEMTSAVLGISVGEENVLEGVKIDGVELPIVNKKVNIPGFNFNTGQAGLFTQQVANSFSSYVANVRNQIPTSTSQLTNDSGFITASDVVETDPTVPAWAKAANKPTYTAVEVGALPSSTAIPSKTSDLTNDSGFITNASIPTLLSGTTSTITPTQVANALANNQNIEITHTDSTYGTYKFYDFIYYTTSDVVLACAIAIFYNKWMVLELAGWKSDDSWHVYATTLAEAGDIPTTVSSFTNDSGYLTSSDIASVLKYKGTKSSYSALPSSDNVTGDVWHLTDTGAEWAWDGSAWQELGTAIDLSNYATKATTLSGYGITDAKIQNGTITLGSNTITPLTSYTETDPTVPSWAKQSSKPTYTASEVGALPASTTIPSKTSDLTNDSGFITGYTETDPVFSASAAAGITSTDISNWNAKVSDTGKWNDVSLTKSQVDTGGADILIPYVLSTSATEAKLVTAGDSIIAKTIAIRDANGYIRAKTPSANDNSTKVATTAYVDAAIPDTSNFLTLADLPIYDGTVV